MNHGSLFSGGGGFDLAAEMMGWNNVFHCEKDPFCQTILKHYWPKSDTHENIKTFNAKKYKGKIDILTGGFPCQPFSSSGKRRGTADDRYLWPEMLRVIRECQPTWIVGENVYGIINWNEGLVFDQVHADLEREGYEVQTIVLPAASVNAPHRRYRTWFVARRVAKDAANANSNGRKRGNRKNGQLTGEAGQHAQRNISPLGQHARHTFGIGQPAYGGQETGRVAYSERSAVVGSSPAGADHWREWPTESPVCSKHDGLPGQLDGITFPKWRSSSVTMYGNAIVPQVAMQIFQVIEAMSAA